MLDLLSSHKSSHVSPPLAFPLPASSSDPLPEYLPPVFRIASLLRMPEDKGFGVLNEAYLYHDQAALKVSWKSNHVDTRLQGGSLVGIRWFGRTVSISGAVQISRLVLLERPEAYVDLFRTVPPVWVKDRDLITRGSALWSQMSRPFQHLFNAVLWERGRFHRYLTGPASLSGHHNGVNGNFRHAVEVAEQCLAMARGKANICIPVLLAAALLHDAGKADEYVLRPNHNGFVMSDRGMLVGHRHTILEWLALARSGGRVIVPESHYLGLMHCLTAARGVEWLGIREPLSLEATILSAADRLSGQSDLVGRSAPLGQGFGAFHRHLKGRPYVLGSLEVTS